jgi:hypothetical protein
MWFLYKYCHQIKFLHKDCHHLYKYCDQIINLYKYYQIVIKHSTITLVHYHNSEFATLILWLMFKVSHACNNHYKSILFAEFNAVLISNRTTGLNETGNSLGSSDFNTVIKREKSIRGQCSSF